MKKILPVLILILTLLNIPCVYTAHAAGDSFTQKDREMLVRLDERLNQMDKRIQELREDMNKRFEQVDKRFEELRQDMNNRFEQVDKRFEQVNKRFETIQQLMMAIVGAFAAIVAATIAFALWDRRTMVRPFEDKVKKIEDDIAGDKKKTERLISVLREYAKKNEDVAKILRSFSLL